MAKNGLNGEGTTQIAGIKSYINESLMDIKDIFANSTTWNEYIRKIIEIQRYVENFLSINNNSMVKAIILNYLYKQLANTCLKQANSIKDNDIMPVDKLPKKFEELKDSIKASSADNKKDVNTLFVELFETARKKSNDYMKVVDDWENDKSSLEEKLLGYAYIYKCLEEIYETFISIQNAKNINGEPLK